MTDIEDLKEKVGRYTRLMENDDFIKTLDEVDEQFALEQNVFGVLKADLNSEFVLAKEGARAYSMAIRGLLDRWEPRLEEAIGQQQQEKEDDE